ncbi:MAG: hypothetical protein HQL52_04225 [Magnetococcales bacterium]|nr:hypothetical protein [Magnetococcales bacterium]
MKSCRPTLPWFLFLTIFLATPAVWADVFNHSPYPLFIKSESSGAIHPLPPGKSYLGTHDAVVICQGLTPGQVFKSVNLIDVTVDPAGQARFSVRESLPWLDRWLALIKQRFGGGFMKSSPVPAWNPTFRLAKRGCQTEGAADPIPES